MILHDGEKIWISFTTAGNLVGQAKAWVTQATVLDAKHRIVIEEGDRVRVLANVEGVHACESEAWGRCAAELGAFATAIRCKAEECARRAAALQIATPEAVA